MNNIARLVVTWLPRAQAFSRFCIAQSWASVENNGNERELGVMERQNMFFSSLSISSFFSLLILDNYLKYPENHRERLWTRQVNCILIMKSSDIFIWWPGINTGTEKLYLIIITKEQNVGIIYLKKIIANNFAYV